MKRLPILFLFSPLVAFAAPSDFKGVVGMFISVLSALVPVLMGLALLFFFVGLAKFISKSGDSGSHKDGKQMMVWGIVALAVMVSYLAIIRATQNNIFGSPVPFPTLPINKSLQN